MRLGQINSDFTEGKITAEESSCFIRTGKS